jgi:hypothetical protein
LVAEGVEGKGVKMVQPGGERVQVVESKYFVSDQFLGLVDLQDSAGDGGNIRHRW